MPRLRACRIGMVEQPRPKPRRARALRAPTRRTRPSPGWPLTCASGRVGQMRHGDQFEAAVEDAEHLVALEVDRVDVVADLRIGGGKAEAQVAVVLVERQQVRPDAVAVARVSERTGTQVQAWRVGACVQASRRAAPASAVAAVRWVSGVSMTHAVLRPSLGYYPGNVPCDSHARAMVRLESRVQRRRQARYATQAAGAMLDRGAGAAAALYSTALPNRFRKSARSRRRGFAGWPVVA